MATKTQEYVITRISSHARHQLKQVAAFYNETLSRTLSRLAEKEWRDVMERQGESLQSAKPEPPTTHTEKGY